MVDRRRMFNSDQFSSQLKRINRQMATSGSREFAKNVRLVEVGPRDGLQNEKQIIDTNIKGIDLQRSKVISRSKVNS